MYICLCYVVIAVMLTIIIDINYTCLLAPPLAPPSTRSRPTYDYYCFHYCNYYTHNNNDNNNDNNDRTNNQMIK